jgi:hypothetical protein
VDWDFSATGRPRAQRLFISDGNKDEKAGLLCSGYVSDFGQGIYKVYGVSGPSKLRLRIQKDKSVCAVLSGIFLDEISLPDSARVLPAPDKRSAALQQAAQEWEALRALQSTPEKFLASGERMKEVLRLANQAVRSKAPEEKAAAEWLRWQCTSTLVVAPWATEPAFKNYLAARPPSTVAAARAQVPELLDRGEIGPARLATADWLQLAVKGPAEGEAAALREAMSWFAAYDADFASGIAARFVECVGKRSLSTELIFDAAGDLAKAGDDLKGKVLRPSPAFRVVAALYARAAQTPGDQSAVEKAAFQEAEAMRLCPGYERSAQKRAVPLYQAYLKRWPQGEYSAAAHLRLVELANGLTQPDEPQARQYTEIGAHAAQTLFERAMTALEVVGKTKTPGVQPILAVAPLGKDTAQPTAGEQSGVAAIAAYQMGELLSRIGDKAAARIWYGKVVKLMAGSPLGKKAQEKAKP